MSKSMTTLFCLLMSGSCWAITGGTAASTATDTVGCEDKEVSRSVPGGTDYCAARELWLAGDYAAAERKLRRAASLNNASAQYLLGIAYFNGDGLNQDRPHGLAWLAMASYSDREDHLGTFRSAYAKASEGERTQAEQILDRLQSQVAWRLDDGVRGRERAIAPSLAMGWPGPTLSRSERMGPAPSNVVLTGNSR